MEKYRCNWVKLDSPIYVAYHDNEWGKPIYDDRALFELFSLETQSAGLSWLTVLKKRESYIDAFDGFDLKKVANYTDFDVQRVMKSPNIIKHRAKIESIINNAKKFLEIQGEHGTISEYFWNKVKRKPIINDVASYKDRLSTSALSDAISKELKKRGFKFVGSITIYSFMQACGMIDDHENGCFCKTLCL